MRSVMGLTFRRPHTRTIVKVTGVKREKGRAYVTYEPDIPDSHLVFGRMEINRFNKLIGRKPFNPKRAAQKEK